MNSLPGDHTQNPGAEYGSELFRDQLHAGSVFQLTQSFRHKDDPEYSDDLQRLATGHDTHGKLLFTSECVDRLNARHISTNPSKIPDSTVFICDQNGPRQSINWRWFLDFASRSFQNQPDKSLSWRDRGCLLVHASIHHRRIRGILSTPLTLTYTHQHNTLVV